MRSASQKPSDTATAGVITRPPFLYLGCLVLGLALDHLLPLPLAWRPEAALTQRTLGGVLTLMGVAMVTAGVRNFSRAATPVPSNQPVRALVTTGIHGWSRNPIYVGMFPPVRRHRLGCAQPVGSCTHAASRHHPALRRGRARGGLS